MGGAGCLGDWGAINSPLGVFFVIILFMLLAFKLLFLLFPETVLLSARSGLLLWFNNVLPALLPFAVISNIFIGSGLARTLGQKLSPVMRFVFGLPGAGGFAFIVGLTSGYPLGAKAVADLHAQQEINTKEAQHLLAFCNNAGPIFILGTIGVGMFMNRQLGYVLWIGHVLSALVLGVVIRAFVPGTASPSVLQMLKTPKQDSPSINIHLGDAVKKAMETMVVIGGMIIFFSVVTGILGEIGLPDTGFAAGLFSGIVEVTGGVQKISVLGKGFIPVIIAAFLIAFGGLSIHMQALHFLSKTSVNKAVYFSHKLLHGLLAAVITSLLYYFVV